MICYIEYGSGATQVHLDLLGTEFSAEIVNAGSFATPAQELTQTVVKLAIKGRPNLYHASATLGDLMNQVQVSEGRAIRQTVWFYYQPAHLETVWRARVKAIAFTPEPGSGEFWKNQRFVKGDLSIVHAIWEGELTTVPLTNTNGTDITAGLAIENTEDATHDNTVFINGEDITGDVPTPAMIEMTNTYAGTGYVDRVIIGQNVYSYPGNMQQVWEFEVAEPGLSAVDANCSNGEYIATTILPAVVNDFTWTMTANDINYFGGNQIHVVLRLATLTANDADECNYRFKITYSGTVTPLYQTDPIYIYPIGGFFFDMGVIRIPPWRVDENGLTDTLDFYCVVETNDGTNKSVRYDALHLIPVDGFREIRTFGQLFVAQNERLVDDEIENELYQDTGSGTARYNSIAALGGKIYLEPGKDQKLYFLTNGNNSTGYYITRSWTVIVKYRPRRLVL